MKKIIITGIVLCFILLLSLSSCKKEASCIGCDNNIPPVAVAGPDQVISLPLNKVILNGRNSMDADGSIIRWQWNKISGPNDFIIQQPDSSITTVESLSPGVYQFELAVKDNNGYFAKDTILVKVMTPVIDLQPPVALAGADQVITLPVNTALLNGYNSYDLNHSITGYEWSQIAGPTFLGIPGSSGQVQLNNLRFGTYEFELKVSNNVGLFSKDSIKIFVNDLPTASPAIFTNLFWVIECNLEIPNIYSFVPAVSNLIVQFQFFNPQGQPSNWITLPLQGSQTPGDWYYNIVSGNLRVYAGNLDCSYDDAISYSLKIIY